MAENLTYFVTLFCNSDVSDFSTHNQNLVKHVFCLKCRLSNYTYGILNCYNTYELKLNIKHVLKVQVTTTCE